MVRLLLLVIVGMSSLACAGAVDFRDHDPQRASNEADWAALHSLSGAEQQALARGDLVQRPQVSHGSRRYFGGTAHLMLAAPAERVAALLAQPRVIERVLPRTKRATLLERRPGLQRIELLQGNSWVEATYTVTLIQQTPSSDGSHRVAFALDPRRSHDIDDVRGFFSVRPISPGHCVVSLTAYVDLGSSLATLFEGPIQNLILSTPLHVRGYVEEQAALPGVVTEL